MSPISRRIPKIVRTVALACLAAVACPEHGLAFILDLDQPGGIYPKGKEVVLTVKADANSKLADLDKVEVLANGRTLIEVAVTRTEPEWQGKFTPPSAGWFVCEARRKNAAPKEKLSAVGILVAPETIGPAKPEPADFDAFWKRKKAELSAAALHPQLTPLTGEQKEQEFMSGEGRVAKREENANQLEKDGMERWNLEIGTLPLVYPVRGYLARPSKAGPRSCPVILLLHAAGIGQFWCRGNSIEAMDMAKKYHAVVIDLNAHGIMNGGSKEYYEAMEKELKAHKESNASNWNCSLLAGISLRLLRTIEYVGTLPEWDGKHIVCIGESQGGGQALSAAGLDPRVSGVVALVPAMCDLAGPLAGRPPGFPYPVTFQTKPENVDGILSNVLYCDNIYLSKRSRAKTLIFAGLIDPTCPSPGITAAYNALPGEKKIYYFPHKPHNNFPAEDLWIGNFIELRDTFLRDHFSN